MPKIDLKRQYVYSGVDYGPGPTEIKDQKAFDAISDKEEVYANHLKAGGEPLAPVTPSIAGDGAATTVENKTALNTPAAPPTPASPGTPHVASAPSPNPKPVVAAK